MLQRMDRLANCVATFFFVGRVPKAPGTAGSLAALPLAWWLWKLPLVYAWSSIVLLFALGVWAAHSVIRRTGKEDHQSIVMDEVVGILVTTSVAAHLWWHYALAFCCFRLFDIFKPGPVGWLDAKVKGGLGAMTDDLAAAVLAALVLHVLLFYSAGMVGLST
jgi:phosphatidylglycerophosphatase A